MKKDFAMGCGVGGLSVALAYAITKVDYLTSEWECDVCGICFRPPFKEYVLAPHTPKKRKLICPVCGRKAYLKCEHDYKKAYYRHIKKKKPENKDSIKKETK